MDQGQQLGQEPVSTSDTRDVEDNHSIGPISASLITSAVIAEYIVSFIQGARVAIVKIN